MNTEKMKRRYTQQEKAKLVSEYQNSGLPQKTWCSEHHISVNTLHKWMQAVTMKSETCPQNWMPIAIERDAYTLHRECVTLQIGKCRIDVSELTDKKLLAEVLEIMVGLC